MSRSCGMKMAGIFHCLLLGSYLVYNSLYYMDQCHIIAQFYCYNKVCQDALPHGLPCVLGFLLHGCKAFGEEKILVFEMAATPAGLVDSVRMQLNDRC